MNAGAYSQKIMIEKLMHDYDNIGNPVEKWKPFKRDYAYMNGLSGKEYWEAATLNAENTVDFVCRWKKFFDDNVQFRNEIVKIRAVHSDE